MKIEAKAYPNDYKRAFLTIDSLYDQTLAFPRESDRDEFVRLINAGQAALEREELANKAGLELLTPEQFLERKAKNRKAVEAVEQWAVDDTWEQRRWELFKVVVEFVDDRPVGAVEKTDALIAEFRKTCCSAATPCLLTTLARSRR